MKKSLVLLSVLALLLITIVSVSAEETEQPLMGEPNTNIGEPGGDGEETPPEWTDENKCNDSSEPIQEQETIKNQTMDGNFEEKQYTWRNRYRYEIQNGIENETVVKECNITKKEGKMYIHSYEYQNGMSVEIKEQNGHKLEVKVSAEFKEGKVLVLNVDENAFKIKNSQKLLVKFDGNEIKETGIDEVVFGNGTEAKYAKAVGTGGSQYVVYIPHFSEHIITIETVGQSTTSSISLISAAIGASLITIGILILVAIKSGKYRKH